MQDLDLIVDTDMGLDDMAALLMLVTAGARLCLVTTVHGVCAAPVAAPLAQRLLLGVDGSARVVPKPPPSWSPQLQSGPLLTLTPAMQDLKTSPGCTEGVGERSIITKS